MAEEKPPAPQPGIPAFDRLGEKITVPPEQVPELEKLGGRVASPEELAEARSDARYANESTARKVATTVTMAGPALYPIHAYLRSQGATVDPRLEAYTQGVSNTFTGGLASVGMKELVREVGGDDAAHAYGQQALDTEKAHEGLYHVGQGAGFVGALSAGGSGGALGKAGKFIPGVGISALGESAEQLAARGLTGLAERGVLGRAAATGLSLGVRGGVEGAIYGAANEYSEEKLGESPVVADKVFAAMGMGALGGFAGGALLGGGGSLVKSGAGAAFDATAGKLGKGLASFAKKGEGFAADAEAKANAAIEEGKTLGKEAVAQAKAAPANAVAETLEKGAAATGTNVTQEKNAIDAFVDHAASKDVQKGVAYDQAAKSILSGNGLQSTKFVKMAERYLPNGTQDLGEVMLRRNLINVDDGIINAARHGTPADIAPRAAAELDLVGKQIGDITEASGGRIKNTDVVKSLMEVVAPYDASAATRPIAKSLRSFGADLLDSLRITGDEGSVSVQDLLRERKALDKMVFENAALDPSMQIQVKRELRSKLEGLVVQSLDESSGKVPGELADKYKLLKKDFTALSIISEAAEDSAARSAKAGTFGLRDMLFGGGGLSGLALGAGHKIVRERGNAAAAVLLYRMAEMGTLTKVVRSVDDSIGRAARGLVTAPKPKPLPLSHDADIAREAVSTAGRELNIIERAQHAAKRVAAAQASPEAFAAHVNAQTERIAATSPQLASGLQQRITSVFALLASKTPAASPDPYNPHPAPRMNHAEATSYLRSHYYAEKPQRFFDEIEHGRITREGAEVARLAMPDAFAELQARMGAEVADAISRGIKVPFSQRRRIDTLLETQTDPSSRPDVMKTLQANVQSVEASGKMSPDAAPPAPVPKRPFAQKTTTQQSPYDRLTEGIGRR